MWDWLIWGLMWGGVLLGLLVLLVAWCLLAAAARTDEEDAARYLEQVSGSRGQGSGVRESPEPKAGKPEPV